MSEFAKIVDESSKPKTRGKFGSDYVRISSDHQTTVRVLDARPEVMWSHFVPRGHHAFPGANAGKGMSFTCLGFDACPICAWNKSQKSKDESTKDVLNARRLYTFNVLDRTQVTVCPDCEVEHYETNNLYPSECECGTDLTSVEVVPRNRIQIMQKGKRIVDQFKSFEEEEELGDLRGYDIKLDTRGTGTDVMTNCIPKQKSKVDMKAIVGDDWESKLYDIKEIVTPMSSESVNRILAGEDFYTVLGRGKDTN